MNQFVLDIRFQILRCSSWGLKYVDPAGSGRTALASPRARGSCHRGGDPPWQSPSSTCSRCPRNARLIMARVMKMFIIRSKHFLQKVASVAIACSWTRLMRCPAFHRPNAILASRCDWGFSCDLIFTPNFFGLSNTPLAHSFCIADGSPNNQQL